MRIAEQEMLHLALVQNLLTAVGAGPHLARPNFPVPPRAFPARIQIVLLPFGEEALRHFAFLERPEGEPIDDAEAFAAIARAQPLPDVDEDEIGPIVADFETISHLYRSIEDGLATLAERLGEDKLFIGPAERPGDGRALPLSRARRGHGSRVGQGRDRDDRRAGRGRARRLEDVAFRPADEHARRVHRSRATRIRTWSSHGRSSVPTFGRRRAVQSVPLISAHFTVRATDLLNAIYEVVLQVLARYFNHTDESDAQLAALADVAFFLMEDCVSPLGELVTRLPIGGEYPGKTAGPAFELFYDADWLLPHREAAWQLIGERLNELADFAVSCRDECPPGHVLVLSAVAEKLRAQADRLG